MKNLFIVILLFIGSVVFAQTFYEKGNITEDTINVNEVTVTGSYTAVKETPFSFTNLNHEVIQARQPFSEPAILLSQTPSIVTHSDNGLGNGYIYYRMRGIDQTRINSTFNGVPMNEPEDQGIYYNNYPNFLSAVNNIQIIRGAGMTKSGVSSYGGSMNFNSLKFPDKPGLFAQGSVGSYGSLGSSGGIMYPNFFITTSSNHTNGYKNNVFNNSYSTFYGAKLKSFKFYGFVGKQRNGMGWLGEPLDSINSNPRYNSNKPNETDDFSQIHSQLHWERFGLHATVYHTGIHGWYDTDIAHFDPSLNWGDLMNRIELWSNQFGTNLNYNLKVGNWLNTNYGVSAYTYYREHVGSYNGEEAYKNTGYRNEVAPYVKGEITSGRFSIYGDVQYRYSMFSYDGQTPFPTQKYSFINWSGGVTIRTGAYSNIYYGIGMSHREPTRTDLFMGNDDFIPEMYNPTVPEQALDNELGFRYNDQSLKVNVNTYYMSFKNEIVLNGQYGPNGILLHQNVDQSFRSGIELDGRYKWQNGFEYVLAANVSYNQIKEDGEIFSPVMTPNVIVSTDIKYNLSDWFNIGLNVKYRGDSYIDFSNEHTLPAATTLNTYAGFKWKKFELIGSLNNLTNELILGNAVMGYDGEPLYFVMAGTNGFLTLKYSF